MLQKAFTHLLKNIKADFVVPCGREIGLNSKYNKEKWEFRAKEQKGVSDWKTTKRKHWVSGILDKLT